MNNIAKQIIKQVREKYKGQNISTEVILEEMVNTAMNLPARFKSIKEHGLPPLETTVWLYNKKFKNVAIGCRSIIEGEWYWSVMDRCDFWIKDNLIMGGDAEIDDWEFTHWCELPELP